MSVTTYSYTLPNQRKDQVRLQRVNTKSAFVKHTVPAFKSSAPMPTTLQPSSLHPSMAKLWLAIVIQVLGFFPLLILDSSTSLGLMALTSFLSKSWVGRNEKRTTKALLETPQ